MYGGGGKVEGVMKVGKERKGEEVRKREKVDQRRSRGYTREGGDEKNGIRGSMRAGRVREKVIQLRKRRIAYSIESPPW